MKVIGLDGRTYAWDLRGHVPAGSDERPRSSLHLRARALLATLFPLDVRCEEALIPGAGRLFADFVVPARKLIVEANGIQHDQEVARFHKTTLDFWRSRQRDARKVEWCNLNQWSLACLPHDESDAEWAARILAACGAPPDAG